MLDGNKLPPCWANNAFFRKTEKNSICVLNFRCCLLSCWICWNSTLASRLMISRGIHCRTVTWRSCTTTVLLPYRRLLSSNFLIWDVLSWPTLPALRLVMLSWSIFKILSIGNQFLLSTNTNDINPLFILFSFSTTVLQDVAAYLKLLPPPDNSANDEKDKQFLLELLVIQYLLLH